MIDPTKIEKILLRMPNWIGDVVMATSILPEVRKRCPKAKITLLCKYPQQDLLKFNPYIDKVESFTKETKQAILKKLKKEKFDLGILTTNSFSSAWDFFRLQIKYRVGFATDFRTLLLTHPVKKDLKIQKQHLVKTYHKLIAQDALASCGPLLFTHPKEQVEVDDFLRKIGEDPATAFFGINPGAAYGSAKCWMPERFKEVIQGLHVLYPQYKFLVFGDFSAQKIAKKITEGLETFAVDLTGKTSLRLLVLLLKRCKAVLTNDSGPMHIADSLRVPVVALFGSTDPLVTGPFYTKQVVSKQVACAPCFLRTCPIDFKCMQEISSEEVINKIKTLLVTC